MNQTILVHAHKSLTLLTLKEAEAGGVNHVHVCVCCVHRINHPPASAHNVSQRVCVAAISDQVNNDNSKIKFHMCVVAYG